MSGYIPGHRIDLELNNMQGVVARFSCENPVGTRCRQTCLNPHCEEGCLPDPPPGGHDLVDAGYCGHVVFLEEDGAFWWELYTGSPGPALSGPIETQVCDAVPSWRYSV